MTCPLSLQQSRVRKRPTSNDVAISVLTLLSIVIDYQPTMPACQFLITVLLLAVYGVMAFVPKPAAVRRYTPVFAAETVEVCGFKDCKRAGGGPRLEKLIHEVKTKNSGALVCLQVNDGSQHASHCLMRMYRCWRKRDCRVS